VVAEFRASVAIIVPGLPKVLSKAQEGIRNSSNKAVLMLKTIYMYPVLSRQY
jgi:hypothetical protein